MAFFSSFIASAAAIHICQAIVGVHSQTLAPSRAALAGDLLRQAIGRVKGAASWIATASSLDTSRLATLRAGRDNDRVAALLPQIRDTAAGPDNLLYPMREALRAKATVGEVSDALRDVWGQYVPADAF